MTWSRVVGFLVGPMIVLSVAPTTASAAVKGSAFAGGFVTNLGFPAVCTLSFGTNGQLTQWEYGVLFGGIYTGEYTEVDLGGVTYWRCIVADESPNGFATFSGFCLLGIITTFHNQNLDQGITADGILFRVGTAERRRSAS